MSDIDKLKAAVNQRKDSEDIARLKEAMQKRELHADDTCSGRAMAQKQVGSDGDNGLSPMKKTTYMQLFKQHSLKLGAVLALMMAAGLLIPVMTMDTWVGWLVGLLAMLAAVVVWVLGTALYLFVKVKNWLTPHK